MDLVQVGHELAGRDENRVTGNHLGFGICVAQQTARVPQLLFLLFGQRMDALPVVGEHIVKMAHGLVEECIRRPACCEHLPKFIALLLCPLLVGQVLQLHLLGSRGAAMRKQAGSEGSGNADNGYDQGTY